MNNTLKARPLWAGVAIYLAVQIWSCASAVVWIDIYRQDGITPLEPADPCAVFDWSEPNQVFIYQSIPVGEKLVFIISSDQGEDWSGGLIMADPYRQRGFLSCRGADIDPTNINCELSILPAAGTGVTVFRWAEDDVNGVGIFTGHYAVPGQWYVFDYEATAGGECVMEFNRWNDFSPNPGWQFLHELRFTHVPDLNGDHIVDFSEYAVLAEGWASGGCSQAGGCGQADIDGNGAVNIWDLEMLSWFWLEQTD